MKTSCLALFSLIFSYSVSAQNWIDLGVKAGYGANFFYNQNYLDEPDFTNKMDFGYSLGGKIGLNFGEEHEVTFDAGISEFRQSFSYDVSISPHGKSLTFNSTDLMLLYRHNRDGRYFEVGPGYSLLNKAKGTNEDPDIIEGINGDVKQYLADNYTQLVFGFGAFMLGSDNVGITFGARFRYTLNDIISSDGKAANYPATQVTYESYRGSHPLVAELVIELNWDLGYMAKANCGQRRKFLMF